MLSISKGMSSSDASSYHSKEDYYLRSAENGANSRWAGEGAAALGLTGTVDKDTFKALCEGKNPANGEQLVADHRKTVVATDPATGKPTTEIDPETGKLKTEVVGERRAGNDLTFSAPKSVSVAYAAGGEQATHIKAAHDAAVNAVLKHIEKHNTHFSKSGSFENGKMLTGVFDHATSRSLDAQLHSHAFVINGTMDKGGNFHANDPKTMFQDKLALGKLYRSQLKYELEQRGFSTRFEAGKEDARDNMYIELTNVDPALCQYFSQRREAIEARVKEWEEAGLHKNVERGRLYEMAALDTRDPKQEVSKEDVIKEWIKGFEANGTTREEFSAMIEADRQAVLLARAEGKEAARDFEVNPPAGEGKPAQESEVKTSAAATAEGGSGREPETEKGQGDHQAPEAKATPAPAADHLEPGKDGPIAAEGQPGQDSQLEKSEKDAAWLKEEKGPSAAEAVLIQIEGQVEKYTPAEIVALVGSHMTETEAVADRKNLLDNVVTVAGGVYDLPTLEHAVDSTAGVERMGQGPKGREYYTTSDMRELEARNLASAKGLAGTFTSCTSEKEVNAFLATLVNEDGKAIKLSDGQRDHVMNELTGRQGVAATQGDPGTGKTMASKVVEQFNQEVLMPSGRNHYTVNIAYTSKAAQEMRAASGRPSRTIDSFLNAYAKGSVGLLADGQTAKPKDVKAGKIDIPFGAQVVLKVDEVSFLGAKQAEHLLNIVKDLRSKNVECKIQLTGDTKQLQAIQSGDFFRQLQALGADFVDQAQITQIQRQKDPGLLKIATDLNAGANSKELGTSGKAAIDALQGRGAVFEEADRGKLIAVATELYMKAADRDSHFEDKAARGEKASVILVTATNADRHELNASIRAARVNAGQIEKGGSFNIQTTANAGLTADAYKAGQTLVFSGFRNKAGDMQAWGSKKLYQEGKVTSRDLEKNTVDVQWSWNDKNKETGVNEIKTMRKTFRAEDLANKTTLYNEDKRNLSEGDKIVFLKNDKGLGVENGTFGTIKAIEGNVLTVGIGEGKEAKDVLIDLDTYRMVDHAYGVTTHKSQGATVETALMFAYVKPELKQALDESKEAGAAADKEAGTGSGSKGGGKESVLPPWAEKALESFGESSYNQLNVAITRAQWEAMLITNSIEGLKKAVEHVTAKTSTLTPDKVVGEEGKGKREAQAERQGTPEQKSQTEKGAKVEPKGNHQAAATEQPAKEGKAAQQDSERKADLAETAKINAMTPQERNDKHAENTAKIGDLQNKLDGGGLKLKEMDDVTKMIGSLEKQNEKIELSLNIPPALNSQEQPAAMSGPAPTAPIEQIQEQSTTMTGPAPTGPAEQQAPVAAPEQIQKPAAAEKSPEELKVEAMTPEARAERLAEIGAKIEVLQEKANSVRAGGDEPGFYKIKGEEIKPLKEESQLLTPYVEADRKSQEQGQGPAAAKEQAAEPTPEQAPAKEKSQVDQKFDRYFETTAEVMVLGTRVAAEIKGEDGRPLTVAVEKATYDHFSVSQEDKERLVAVTAERDQLVKDLNIKDPGVNKAFAGGMEKIEFYTPQEQLANVKHDIFNAQVDLEKAGSVTELLAAKEDLRLLEVKQAAIEKSMAPPTVEDRLDKTQTDILVAQLNIVNAKTPEAEAAAYKQLGALESQQSELLKQSQAYGPEDKRTPSEMLADTKKDILAAKEEFRTAENPIAEAAAAHKLGCLESNQNLLEIMVDKTSENRTDTGKDGGSKGQESQGRSASEDSMGSNFKGNFSTREDREGREGGVKIRTGNFRNGTTINMGGGKLIPEVTQTSSYKSAFTRTTHKTDVRHRQDGGTATLKSDINGKHIHSKGEVVDRAGNLKAKWESDSKTSMLGTTKTTRTEKDGDVAKITKSSINRSMLGNDDLTGTTKTINRNGDYKMSEWTLHTTTFMESLKGELPRGSSTFSGTDKKIVEGGAVEINRHEQTTLSNGEKLDGIGNRTTVHKDGTIISQDYFLHTITAEDVKSGAFNKKEGEWTSRELTAKDLQSGDFNNNKLGDRVPHQITASDVEKGTYDRKLGENVEVKIGEAQTWNNQRIADEHHVNADTRFTGKDENHADKLFVSWEVRMVAAICKLVGAEHLGPQMRDEAPKGMSERDHFDTEAAKFAAGDKLAAMKEDIASKAAKPNAAELRSADFKPITGDTATRDISGIETDVLQKFFDRQAKHDVSMTAAAVAASNPESVKETAKIDQQGPNNTPVRQEAGVEVKGGLEAGERVTDSSAWKAVRAGGDIKDARKDAAETNKTLGDTQGAKMTPDEKKELKETIGKMTLEEKVTRIGEVDNRIKHHSDFSQRFEKNANPEGAERNDRTGAQNISLLGVERDMLQSSIITGLQTRKTEEATLTPAEQTTVETASKIDQEKANGTPGKQVVAEGVVAEQWSPEGIKVNQIHDQIKDAMDSFSKEAKEGGGVGAIQNLGEKLEHISIAAAGVFCDTEKTRLENDQDMPGASKAGQVETVSKNVMQDASTISDYIKEVLADQRVVEFGLEIKGDVAMDLLAEKLGGIKDFSQAEAGNKSMDSVEAAMSRLGEASKLPEHDSRGGHEDLGDRGGDSGGRSSGPAPIEIER